MVSFKSLSCTVSTRHWVVLTDSAFVPQKEQRLYVGLAHKAILDIPIVTKTFFQDKLLKMAFAF